MKTVKLMYVVTEDPDYYSWISACTLESAESCCHGRGLIRSWGDAKYGIVFHYDNLEDFYIDMLKELTLLAFGEGVTQNLVFYPMADPPYVTGDEDDQACL